MNGLPIELQLELLGRLVLSVVLAGVLGWERQMGQHPAGLRTHILVSLGATAYTMAGTYGVAGSGTVQDAGRVAAQIVTGIGFLGAGTIWRSGSDRIIYGLTTAASIWVAASIGMLVGFGMYILAAGCAVAGFTVLRLLKPLEQAPLAFTRPRIRRAAPAGQAAGYADEADPMSAADGDSSESAADGGVATAEDGLAQPHAVPERRRRKSSGKKDRKRKHRDAEYESIISDAPAT